jgi:diaminohydroxyphosphoribosylaminopyrimidine deaminase / 5-amino-6-(5-phosphoribosylamino)uracil reductase
MSSDDERFMARALSLASLGLETTSPNPRVGCVIVRDGVVVAEGWHRKAGEAHAEAEALAKAGESARGATAYVTLEPCSHHGRTPPCADAIVAAGIARLVAATPDPNPRVAGAGLDRLRAAGIEVLTGVLAEPAVALNKGFFSRMQLGRPRVLCKLAMSLTGEAARTEVQRLRGCSCAVLTGVGTVLADDPRLDVRDAERQPLRVLLDSRLRTPTTARTLAAPGSALIAHVSEDPAQAKALRDAGAELVRFDGKAGRLPLRDVLEWLARRECNEVLLEAGPTLAGAFAEAGLIDEYRIYLAPVFLGSNARPLLALPLGQMSERMRLRIKAVDPVGEDWRISAEPRH